MKKVPLTVCPTVVSMVYDARKTIRYAIRKDTQFDLAALEENVNLLPRGIDHSFLTYKKELEAYGFRIGKISMKKQTIAIERAD